MRYAASRLTDRANLQSFGQAQRYGGRLKTTRRDIAEAALALMAEKGYRGTSIGAIEEAVGLAPRAGGFYRHFKNKEEILFEAMSAYSEEILSELDEMKTMPAGTPREELTWMTRRIVDHAGRHTNLRLVLRRDGRNLPRVREAIRNFNQADAWDVFVEWMRKKLGKRRIDHSVRLHTFQIFSTLALILYLQDYGEHPLGLDQNEVLEHWVARSIEYLEKYSVR